MALADVKNRIKAQLELVTGIGKVYARMIRVDNQLDEKNKLVSGGRINVWWLTRETSTLFDRDVNQALVDQREQFIVHGFYALDDDTSEAAFDALVDAILVQLNNDRRPPSLLGATVLTADPPFLRTQDARHYGPSQALCHHAEIVMTVQWRHLQ
jgi:hypothetical protein